MTLDFTGVPMVRLDLAGVSNITVKGFVSTGAQYQALYVLNSHNIVLQAPRSIGAGTAGILISGSDTVEVAAPWISESSGDGVDIAASTNVNVHDGVCEDNIPTTIHPDCVQGWSATSYPLQHIKISNMTATGETQGFDVWDHSNFGATDVQVLNNITTNTYGSCIGIFYVTALVVKGNVCRSLNGGTSNLDIQFCPGAIISGNSTVPPTNNQ